MKKRRERNIGNCFILPGSNKSFAGGCKPPTDQLHNYNYFHDDAMKIKVSCLRVKYLAKLHPPPPSPAKLEPKYSIGSHLLWVRVPPSSLCTGVPPLLPHPTILKHINYRSLPLCTYPIPNPPQKKKRGGGGRGKKKGKKRTGT